MVKKVLIIDDDRYCIQLYVHELQFIRFSVDVATTVEEAFKLARLTQYDIVVLDVMLPHGSILSDISTHGGFLTGVEILNPLREIQERALFVGLSNSTSPSISRFFRDAGGFFCLKQDYPPFKFAEELKRVTGGQLMKPRAFIIHGHNEAIKLQLKNFIQNRLHFDEPIILSEMPSRGRTIMEKFEEHAKRADIAFALLTPDDYVVTGGPGRGRQNVIFELGYFLGALGRKTGRVFLLVQGDVDIPSDLSGVIYIDITNGIESAAENIRREIEALP